MRPKDRFGVSAALCAAALALLVSLSARAQSFSYPGDETVAVEDVLRQGRLLESESRWGDALSYYEEAVRKYPGQPSLEQSYRFARLHYDLCRRYADESYLAMLEPLSLEDALDVYTDVVLKIQAHYVEAPQWKEVVEHGTSGLEVALGDPQFRSRCAPAADDRAIDAFRGELRRALGPMVISGRDDACRAVAFAARLAHERLGTPPAAAVLECLCGATNALDIYSAYLTPGQLGELYSQIEGNFVGLGVELKADTGALLIVRVIPGSPAEQAGIAAGDRIVAVGGRLTSDLSTDQAANLLQGPEGTTVELAVEAPGQAARRVIVHRERVEVPSIEGVKIVNAAQGIAYLKLTCFQKTTSRDLDNALWSLHRGGMRSLIIDLRGNPGGLLATAVDVADKFIDRGLIVSTRGRSPGETFSYSAHEPGTWRVPLVVLIDGDSASAAEIFAGAIRDHQRGTIVGERSYGKGSVQGIFPLSTAEAGVRLTTAKFYSPNGNPYSGVGVAPNQQVHRVARPVEVSPEAPADDVFLTAAVEAARQQLQLHARR